VVAYFRDTYRTSDSIDSLHLHHAPVVEGPDVKVEGVHNSDDLMQCSIGPINHHRVESKPF